MPSIRVFLFVLSSAALIALSSNAWAQKIPSAESGTVPFVLEPKATSSSGLVAERGDMVWIETARPAFVVRLLSEAPARVRPSKTAAVPAGTLLFGYKLSTGMAFCPSIDPSAARGRVQCFRDLDGDGTFDAGYVTRSRGEDSQYLSAYVHAIAAVPKLAYERVDPSQAETAELGVRFKGIRRGLPEFEIWVENEKLDEAPDCRRTGENSCTFLGVPVTFSSERSRGATLTIGPRERRAGLAVEYESLR